MFLPMWLHVIIFLISVLYCFSALMDLVPPPKRIEGHPRYPEIVLNRVIAIEEAGGIYRFKKKAWFKLGLGTTAMVLSLVYILLKTGVV
jgi:hypothetical protein